MPHIRNKALAIIHRADPSGDSILVCAIPDDAGNIKGWRPLGGSIEFGEIAAQTVARELHEEIQATAIIGKQIGVMENIYTHEGEHGHEIVFLFETTLTDAGLAVDAEFIVVEDTGTRFKAAWMPVARFKTGQDALFPDGLLELL